jgi:hypothetical protein
MNTWPRSKVLTRLATQENGKRRGGGLAANPSWYRRGGERSEPGWSRVTKCFGVPDHPGSPSVPDIPIDKADHHPVHNGIKQENGPDAETREGTGDEGANCPSQHAGRG